MMMMMMHVVYSVNVIYLLGYYFIVFLVKCGFLSFVNCSC